MANEPGTASVASDSLQATRVYTMAGLCLLSGLAIGYLLRGSPSPVAPPQPAAHAAVPPAPRGTMSGGHVPSMEQMRQAADRQAAPLLAKLKSDPNNGAVLIQVGAIYHTNHQFQQAAAYYGRAVQIEPENVAVRTKLASSLYRSGDVDGAIAQLNRALSYDPKDANALFDMGMIKWQGKQDGKGALAAWRQLLKSNPDLSADRKATVQQLIASVLASPGNQQRTEGVRKNDGSASKAP
jgi:cytochrome c-type biogenesis protein CcmH/NrfG